MSIQREGNTFKVFYSYLGDDGKLHKTTKRGFTTKKEAKEFELQAAEKIVKSDKTFEDVYKEWYKRINGVKSYKEYLKYTFDTFCDFKEVPINRLTKQRINEWSLSMLEHNYKPRTINDIYKVFRSILKYASEIYDIKDLSVVIKNVKFKSKEKEVLSVEEFNTLISYETNPIAFAMIWTTYYTGLRLSEIRALEKSDLKDHYLLVRQHLPRAIDSLAPGTKTSPYSFEVALDEQTYKILLPLSKRPGKWLFGDIEPVGQVYMGTHLKDLTIKAGLKKNITPHTLRHSHGSLLLSKGVDLMTISKRLNHKSLTTTTSIYLHEVSNKDQEVVNILDKINRSNMDLKTLSKQELIKLVEKLVKS